MKKMKKALSLMLALSMVLSYVPVPALAEETCAHHVHDQSLCGYVEEVKGAPCTHQCGEGCETELAEDGVTVQCLSHVCPDGDCGYVAEVRGSACTYVCAECAAAQAPVCTGEADCPVSEHSENCAKKLADEAAAEAAAKAAADRAAADAVAALLDALPSLDEIREKDQAGQDEANLQVQEAYNAYRNLTEEQQALLSDAPATFQAYFDFFSAPPSVAADTEGTCGENVIWSFDEASGTLTITGSGAMKNFASVGPWSAFAENLKKVVIGEGVTTVGTNAFYFCQKLEEVQLPSTITVIGASAFDCCNKMKKINLPEGITAIDAKAFYGCGSLETLVLPKTLTDIGGRAFVSCITLKEIKIPNGVTRIPSDAFMSCSGLTKVIIPRSVTSIGNYAFAHCTGLTEITIPKNVNSIGDRGFSFNDNLKTITFMGGCPATMGYPENPYVFEDVTATVYYPQDDTTWNAGTKKGYGGTLTWVAKAINADDYGLNVAGVKVTDEALSGTGWRYDPDENVLYLSTGFTQSVTHKSEKLEIVVDGTVSCGSITSDGSLTMRGKTGKNTDSVIITGGRIRTDGNLTVENLSVNVSYSTGSNASVSTVVVGSYVGEYDIVGANGCLTVNNASLKATSTGNSPLYGIHTGTLVVQGNSYVYGESKQNSVPGIYATQNGSSFSSSCHVEATTKTGCGFRVKQVTAPAEAYFYTGGVSGTTWNYELKKSSDVFRSDGYGSDRDFRFIGKDHVSYRQNSNGTTHSLYCECKTYGMGPAVSCSGGTASCTAKAVCTVCKSEYGSTPAHSFTRQDTGIKYRATAATCTAAATYYYSCDVCGEAGTETFTYGNADTSGHNVVENVCTVCGAVEINESTFPDGVFREYVVANIDADSDNLLTVAERDAVTKMFVGERNIKSLEGIEYFGGLTVLYCRRNSLESLDLSANPALKELTCAENQLKSLKVSDKPALEILDCSDNQLPELDVSANPALKELTCADNGLKELDVSHNPVLEILECSFNQLTELDVSGNPELKSLSCAENQLTQLDLSRNSKLKSLSCEDNQLSCLDVSHCAEELYRRCGGNVRTISVTNKQFDLANLAGFDVTKVSNLEGGSVDGTVLTATENTVTYTYAIGKNQYALFTLKIEGLCADGHDFSVETVSGDTLKTAATCTSPAVYYLSCSAGCDAKSEDATFTSGDKLSHTFTAETVEDKYLKDAATCTSPAIYWKSCSACGATGKETFAFGALGNHKRDENHKCSVCSLIGGSCGENLTWTLVDGVLTVSGTGEMDYFLPWEGYADQVITLVLESGTTTISDNAFRRFKQLKNVTIADTVKTIGSCAFLGCSELENISIPASVTVIGDSAFSTCTKLSRVILSEGLTTIETCAFEGCAKLTELKIPESVTSIGEMVFSNCTALSKVNIPQGVTSIQAYTFQGSGLREITIPDSITTIDKQAFAWCGELKQIIFLGNAPTIAENAMLTVIADAYYPLDNTTWTDSVMKNYGGTITWKRNCNHIFDQKVAAEQYLVSEATCTAKAVYFKSCKCGEKGSETFEHGELLAHTFDRQIAEDKYLVSAASALSPAYYVKSCICGAAGTDTFAYGDVLPGTRVFVSPAELGGAGEVWIDGIRYPVKTQGDAAFVDLPDGAAVSSMVTYGYHVGDPNDVHTQYPVSMQVWALRMRQDGNYTAHRIQELDDILQYSGSSIRITGNKGIRMITSIESHKRDALIQDNLAGYKLLEYGTVLALSGELEGGKPLTLGQSYARSNFAYKRDVADPIFAISGNLVQYTNVLVGFSLDQCREDIAMRSYMILEDASGSQVTLYGGTVYRSIGYIAYQNRTVFAPGTGAYNYVWEIIHHVYGDRYDGDYKG